MYFCMNKMQFRVCVKLKLLHVWVHRFGLKDSLVGLYFEVSAFLELVSIFVPAKRRTGTPRRLALQVKLVPFNQRLASHQPELRSRSWTEREREKRQSHCHPITPAFFCGCAHWGGTNENLRARGWSQGQRSRVKVLMGSRMQSILIPSLVCFETGRFSLVWLAAASALFCGIITIAEQ